MSWLLPTPVLLFAAVALLPLMWLPRGDGTDTPSRPVSLPRLAVEGFVTTLAVIAAVRLAWVVLWLVERRW